MQGIAALVQRELIDPSRQYGPILYSREIPVHPLVFVSEQFYRPVFVDEVLKLLPDLIKQDIAVITELIGLKITRDQMEQIQRYRSALYYTANSISSLDVIFGDANIALDNRNPNLHKRLVDPAHPIPSDKLKQYMAEEGHIFTLYTHNVLEFGLPVLLVLRNFSIAYNNLALEQLNKESK